MEKTIDITTVLWVNDVWQVYANVNISTGTGEDKTTNTYAGSYSVDGPEGMTVDELAADILARF